MKPAGKTQDEGPQTRAAQAQKLTEKGYEYNKEIKIKIFRQMLSKLKKDGQKLIDDLMSQDEEGKTQQDSARISRWKHNYVTLQQTNGDLRALLGEEYEQHRSAHEQRLNELETMRATIESLMSTQDEDKVQKSQAGCPSVKSSSSRSASSSASAVKAQLYLMKVKEDQSVAELKMRSAALEQKHQLEREMQELKLKQERYQLDTEMKVQKAKTEAIENIERQIDSSLLMSEKPEDAIAQTGSGNQVSLRACTTDCHEANTDVTNHAPTQLITTSPSQPSGADSSTPVTAAMLVDLFFPTGSER